MTTWASKDIKLVIPADGEYHRIPAATRATGRLMRLFPVPDADRLSLEMTLRTTVPPGSRGYEGRWYRIDDRPKPDPTGGFAFPWPADLSLLVPDIAQTFGHEIDGAPDLRAVYPAIRVLGDVPITVVLVVVKVNPA